MSVDQISSDVAQRQGIEELCRALSTSPLGLSSDEAQRIVNNALYGT